MDMRRDEFDRLHETMRDGFQGLHRRLDELNGRTRKTELDVAGLEPRVKSLEKDVFRDNRDRSPRAGVDKKTAGALITGLLVALELLHRVVDALLSTMQR